VTAPEDAPGTALGSEAQIERVLVERPGYAPQRPASEDVRAEVSAIIATADDAEAMVDDLADLVRAAEKQCPSCHHPWAAHGLTGCGAGDDLTERVCWCHNTGPALAGRPSVCAAGCQLAGLVAAAEERRQEPVRPDDPMVIAERAGIVAQVEERARRECEAELRAWADEHTGRHHHVDHNGNRDYVDRYASHGKLHRLADCWAAAPGQTAEEQR
jgi:hypothetical protein